MPVIEGGDLELAPALDERSKAGIDNAEPQVHVLALQCPGATQILE